jgi:transposase
MVRIPSAAEEEMRRPGRERERLVSERLQLENRIENLLCLHGIAGFRPRLKKAVERLEALRSFAGLPLPGKTMAELRRLMARHALLCEQLQEIEAERDRVARVAQPDRGERMIQHLARIVGLGLETATLLVREMFCRPFRDRRAVASFAGLTGTPFCSGGIEREQGSARTATPGFAASSYSWPGAGCASSRTARSPNGLRPMVCGAHRRRQGTHPHDHDRRFGPQAAGRAVALCRDR